LLVGIGDPCSSIRAATPVDRTGESACLEDVEVAAFRRLVTQRHVGFASREVFRLSRIDQFQGDAGRKRRRGRFRQAASEKPGGTLAGRYPHRTAQHRRGRGAPPLQRQRCILDALGRRNQLLAGGVEAQPLGQAVEQGRPAKSGLERGQSAGDGRLAEPERAPGGTH